MKTTIEIADPLLREARGLAARQGITFRALVEHALCRAVVEAKLGAPFRLRRASFKGKDWRPNCAVPRGTSCEISPMAVAADDRPRYEHSRLRAS